MYSDNDYRYYLEHRLQESDDILMHYGVKGMKWRHHKNVNTGAYRDLIGDASSIAGRKFYSPNGTTLYSVGQNVVRVDSSTRDNGQKFARQQRKGIASDSERAARDVTKNLGKTTSSINAERKKKRREKIKRMFEREKPKGQRKVRQCIAITITDTTSNTGCRNQMIF